MEACWMLDDGMKTGVITTKRVLMEGRPILLVTHDEEDGVWQFLDGGDVDCEEGVAVGFGNMVRRDPSLRQIADLPRGWWAWRQAPDQPWQVTPRRRSGM